MTDAIHEYFQDVQQCYADIRLARKAFGNTSTTVDEYDQMEKSLGLMYLHCPEDIQGVVLATIEEANWRRPYFNFPLDD
jgi:hypothetical protein